MKSDRSLIVIALGMGIVYVVFFMGLLADFILMESYSHTTISIVLVGMLLIGVMGVMSLQEWGRRFLILGNKFLFFYCLVLMFLYRETIYMVYALVGIIAVLFFNQSSVLACFQPDWRIKRKSVLVVDDDMGLQKTLKKILLPKGYSVLTATTGEKGLQVAKTQRPDLVVLDVILPGIKGREVCTRLKADAETRKIPVIFLTAKDSQEDVNAELAAGALSHITKPVNAKLLLAEIKKVIG